MKEYITACPVCKEPMDLEQPQGSCKCGITHEKFRSNFDVVKAVAPKVRRCDRCRAVFLYRNYNTRFCSKSCKWKAHSIQRRYKLRFEDYVLILNLQEHKCFLCKEALDLEKHTHVDHDHATGRVRGILCRRCNFMVSKFDRDSSLFERLKEYLNLL